MTNEDSNLSFVALPETSHQSGHDNSDADPHMRLAMSIMGETEQQEGGDMKTENSSEEQDIYNKAPLDDPQTTSDNDMETKRIENIDE